jgi:hypothetical protein
MVWHYCPEPYRLCLGCLALALENTMGLGTGFPSLDDPTPDPPDLPMTKKLDLVPSLDAATLEATQLVEMMEKEGLSGSKADYDEVLGHAHEKITQLENAKEFRTRPSKDTYDKEVAPFNAALSVWKKVKALAKQFIGQHELNERASQERALTAAAQSQDTTAIAKASESSTPLSNASVKGRWTYRIVDEALVPAKYCAVVRTVNLHLIENAVADGIREIPGIEIYVAASVRVQGKKGK